MCQVWQRDKAIAQTREGRSNGPRRLLYCLTAHVDMPWSDWMAVKLSEVIDDEDEEYEKVAV